MAISKGFRRALDEATAMLRDIAAAAVDQPVYVLHRDELDERFHFLYSAAYTHPALDLWLESPLRSLRRWQGRGHAMVINNRATARGLLYYAMHELAHCIDADKPGTICRLEPAAWIESVRRDCSTIEAYRGLDGGRSKSQYSEKLERHVGPWAHHGQFWTRVVLHLVHRACRAGIRTRPEDCALDGRYGVSTGTRYLHTLGVELDAWLHRPLADLRHQPLPAAFANLWAEDTEQWRLNYKEKIA